MIQQIVDDAKLHGKHILILGAPRSGTHALGSVFKKLDPELIYLEEIATVQESFEPWEDLDNFCKPTTRKLAHVVQSYGKIFAVKKINELKSHSIIVSLRRRNKIKQFASWMYFKHIGAIYNFDHYTMDYVPPKSITVTMQDIELFIVDQIIDCGFIPDYTLYYEDLDLSSSNHKKNQYAYPIEDIFTNMDFIKQHLGDWKYYE